VTEADVLSAAAGDPETRVIVAYIEGVADGRRFFAALQEAAAVKPVVVLKAGRSAEGARAVSSHTGALAGSDAAFDAAVRQAGAVRALTVEELFDLARGLASQPLPRGKRLLVVTNGGGLGIVSTDAAREAGLEVAALEDPIRHRLAAVLPPTASVSNPVDLVGDADAARYSRALHAIGGAGADAALVVLTAQAATDSAGVARAIVGATREWSIPRLAAFVGGARVAAGARALEDGGIPCYAFPESAVRTLAGMALLAERRERLDEPPPAPGPSAEARAQLTRLREEVGTQLGMLDLAPLLERYGISCVRGEPAETPEAAAAAAERLGGPVALKLLSPDLTHKSEVGGVRLSLRSPGAVAEAARAMLERVRRERPGTRIRGVLVQPMVPPGKELLLGMVRDPQFGPLVMVGFGGIYVEVLRDTATRLAPISPSEALRMLEELRMAPLLRGVRGEPPVDREALARSISRFSLLAAELDELAELEVNPLVAGSAGVIAVDARARLS
jgi:acetyltransferase